MWWTSNQYKTKLNCGKNPPQDQLTRAANICMRDPAGQDYLSPQWHYSKRPVIKNNKEKMPQNKSEDCIVYTHD